jgi:hypothetical protein
MSQQDDELDWILTALDYDGDGDIDLDDATVEAVLIDEYEEWEAEEQAAQSQKRSRGCGFWTLAIFGGFSIIGAIALAINTLAS